MTVVELKELMGREISEAEPTQAESLQRLCSKVSQQFEFRVYMGLRSLNRLALSTDQCLETKSPVRPKATLDRL